MLLVKTKIKESQIAGYGLFADEFIPKDTIIWKLNELIDKVIPVSDLDKFTQLERDFLDMYAYREGNNIILCSDNGRYFNHSATPNTIDLIDERGSLTIAKVDINIGEELVSDYSSFDADFHKIKKMKMMIMKNHK